jgi:hypothetical protein
MPKTTQSVQRAAQVAAGASFASRIDDKRQIEGPVQYARCKMVFDGSNVATDVIDLLELPAGAIVMPELSKLIVTDDMTSGALTIHVGDIVDPDRYCISANCAAPGVIEFIAAAATAFPAALGTPHSVVKTRDAATDTSLIKVTLATFAATIEAGEVYVLLAYKSL